MRSKNAVRTFPARPPVFPALLGESHDLFSFGFCIGLGGGLAGWWLARAGAQGRDRRECLRAGGAAGGPHFSVGAGSAFLWWCRLEYLYDWPEVVGRESVAAAEHGERDPSWRCFRRGSGSAVGPRSRLCRCGWDAAGWGGGPVVSGLVPLVRAAGGRCQDRLKQLRISASPRKVPLTCGNRLRGWRRCGVHLRARGSSRKIVGSRGDGWLSKSGISAECFPW